MTRTDKLTSISIGTKELTLFDVVAVARKAQRVSLSEQAEHKINAARQVVEKIVASDRRTYGVNTGLGALCSVKIDRPQLQELSYRIILSHACGMGPPLKDDQVRAVMFAAIANFSRGHSGVRLEVVQTLVDMLNKGVTPYVPAQGSVGYLTHMAHISLVIIGLGEAYYQGEKMSGQDAMHTAGIATLTLQAKEGLSLVNGTPCMTGISSLCTYDALQLSKWADITGAMSFEALKGTYYAFDQKVSAAKPLAGQVKSAANLRALVRGSEICEAYKDYRTQDALSLRAMPQVHGASRDKIRHAVEMVNTELNSATDNPLIFPDGDNFEAFSACNAHGQSLALTMDMLGMAVAELGSIAERRVDRLINPLVSELPAFLVKESGVNTGFMIIHYVASSLVAENKVLVHPISVDNMTNSAMQEDHLSMGTPAALKAATITGNVQKIMGIELLTAAQALEFHRPLGLGIGTSVAHQLLREIIPSYEVDRVFYPELEQVYRIVQDASWLDIIEAQVGEL